MFIAVFTRAHHWYLSWIRWIQSKTYQTVSLRSILMLSSHLRLCLASGSQSKILY
jgi:hypothetical protein